MLDYETKKELEEAWLYEMAMTIKDAKKIVSQNSFQFKIHIAKCFLFHDTQWYNHWLKEAAGFCLRCDDIKLKPNAKRPQEEFFLSDDMICSEIETAADAKHYLNFAIDRCPELIRDDCTNEEALKFVDLWNNLREELADYFSDDESFDKSVYIEIINDAIKRSYQGDN